MASFIPDSDRSVALATSGYQDIDAFLGRGRLIGMTHLPRGGGLTGLPSSRRFGSVPVAETVSFKPSLVYRRAVDDQPSYIQYWVKPEKGCEVSGNQLSRSMDDIRGLRRACRFEEVLQACAEQVSKDELRVDRDRICFELGYFALIANSSEDLASGSPGPWHQALRLWALLRLRSTQHAHGQEDATLSTFLSDLKDGGVEQQAVHLWYELTAPAYDVEVSGAVKMQQWERILSESFDPATHEDNPEVLIAASRLASSIVGLQASKEQRTDAYAQVEKIYNHLKDNNRRGRILDQASLAVDATFHWARANYYNGMPAKASELLQKLWELRPQRHVAARLLQVQIERFEGARQEQRLASIRVADATLIPDLSDSKCEAVKGEGKAYYAGEAGGVDELGKLQKQAGHRPDLFAAVELARMRATVEIAQRPDRAIELLQEADQMVGREESMSDLAASSQTLPRLLMLGGSARKATKAALELMNVCGFESVTTKFVVEVSKVSSWDGDEDESFFASDTEPAWQAALHELGEFRKGLQTSQMEQREATPQRATPNHAGSGSGTPVLDIAKLEERYSQHESWTALASKRALLRVADVIRAQGHVDVAIEWVEELRLLYPASRSTFGRLLSLYISGGKQPKALELLEKAGELPEYLNPPWRNDPLMVEQARCYLANGRLHKADEIFRQLAARPAASDKVAGQAGLIDVARRRRDLDGARKLAQAAMKSAPEAGDLRAEVHIAEAWAEIQLGDPARALPLIEFAVVESPYELGPWMAQLRCLRILGRHAEAIEIAQQLLGESTERRHQSNGGQRTIGPRTAELAETIKPPNLSVSHGSGIRTELGWCLLDIGMADEAIEHFDLTVRRSPYFSTAARGSIAARRDLRPELIVNHSRDVLKWFKTNKAVGGARDINLEAARVLIARREHDSAAPFIEAVEEDLKKPRSSDDARIRVLFALADAYLDAAEPLQAAKYVERLEVLAGDRVDDRIVMLKSRSCLVNRRPEAALEMLDSLTIRSEAALLAKAISLVELRRFEDALQTLEDSTEDVPRTLEDSPKQCHVRSDARNEIRAWIYLALSESPRKKAYSTHQYLELAAQTFGQLDCTSIGEIHLSGILQARQFRAQVGPTKHGWRVRAARSVKKKLGREQQRDEPVALSLAPAISTIERARSRRPKDPALMRDHAALLLELGNLSGAHRLLHVAAEADPVDARIQLLAGVAHFRRGDIEEAKLHFGRATNLDCLDYVHYRALAKAALLSGDLNEAESAIQRGRTRSHPEGDLALRLIQLEIQVRRARELSRPLVKARMLRGLQSELSDARSHSEFGSQSDEVRTGYWALSASVAVLLGEKRSATRFARKLSPDDSRRRMLEAHTGLAGPGALERLVPAVLLFAGFLFLVSQLVPIGVWLIETIAPDVLEGGNVDEREFPGLDPTAAGVSLLALVLAAALPRIVGISVRDIGVELSPSEPVSELIHTDLDLSSNRLLLISGFSNYRPYVPAEDHEQRLFAARWGGG